MAAARRKKQPETGVRGAFPLPKDHYLSTPSIAPRSHSSGPVVAMLNETLGVPGTIFNGDTRKALMARQEELGLPMTGVVDETTWDVLAGGGVSDAQASDD